MPTLGFTLLVLYTGSAAWLFSWADRRLGHHQQLPMQWGFNGQPNWFAPRRIALIATPILSGIGFFGATLITAVPVATHTGPAGVNRLLVALALLGIAIYAGYLWLVVRWDRTRTL